MCRIILYILSYNTYYIIIIFNLYSPNALEMITNVWSEEAMIFHIITSLMKLICIIQFHVNNLKSWKVLKLTQVCDVITVCQKRIYICLLCILSQLPHLFMTDLAVINLSKFHQIWCKQWIKFFKCPLLKGKFNFSYWECISKCHFILKILFENL